MATAVETAAHYYAMIVFANLNNREKSFFREKDELIISNMTNVHIVSETRWNIIIHTKALSAPDNTLKILLNIKTQLTEEDFRIIEFLLENAVPNHLSMNAFGNISKFLLNKATITLEEISREWVGWNQEEQLDFIHAYHVKQQLTEEDFRIIEFLLENAAPNHLSMLPFMIIKLPDKKKALRYLIDFVRKAQIEDINMGKIGVGNYYQAIGNLDDPDVISLLKEKIMEMLDYSEIYGKGLLTKGGFFNYVASDCLTALNSLCKLEPKDEYKKLLEGFMLHPNETVAHQAKIYIEQINQNKDNGAY